MNYNDMSLLELREIAKEKDLKNVSKMKKQELAEMLESLENQEKPANEQSVKNNSAEKVMEHINQIMKMMK